MTIKPRDLCMTIAQACQTGSAADVLQAIADARLVLAGPHWIRDLDKLAAIVQDDQPRFSIFAKSGNSKLPFVSFSSLAVVGCPGAGECASFCYSLTAWRYPAAFCKAAQNTWLQRHNFDRITMAFKELFKVKKLANGFDFRLYVDGDYSSVSDVYNWQKLIEANPTVNAYGYSKSFAILLGFDMVNNFAPNYVLNMSSGHNASPELAAAFAALPVVRGEFKAVNVGYQVKASHYSDKAHADNLRTIHKQETGRSAFVCPGACGDCTPSGHACGSKRFTNVDIIIAVH